MAPDVKIVSYTWVNDVEKIESALASEPPAFQITNHSYGPLRGWVHSPTRNAWVWYGNPADSEEEDSGFGKYDTYSGELDGLVNRNVAVFVSAGNDRDKQNDPNTISNWDGRHYSAQLRQFVTLKRPSNLQHSGYDTLNAYAVAKNVITVGAIKDMPLGGLTPEDVSVTQFSSWGPTDDGRIKPDVVANGAAVYSPSVERQGERYNPQAYALKSGTSQASPAAAGIAALLNELNSKRSGRTLRPEEMKAILIHTAISPDSAPNYQIGWGAIDAKSAGDIIAGEKGLLQTGNVKKGGDGLFYAKANGDPIRITLCWTDPPSPPNDGGLNDRTPTLINDLDLVVTDKLKQRYYPWSLNPDQPSARATRTGPNTVDNVERIDIGSNDIQSDVLAIDVIGSSQAQGQPYALVVSGLDLVR
jgi:subtilisin family serine protease